MIPGLFVFGIADIFAFRLAAEIMINVLTEGKMREY